MRRPWRLLLFTIGPLVLMAGVLCWLIYREIGQTQRDQAFIAAARAGDAVVITRLLAQGADINAPEKPAQSPSSQSPSSQSPSSQSPSSQSPSSQSPSLWQLLQELVLHRDRTGATGPTALMAAMNAMAAMAADTPRHSQHDLADYPKVITILLDRGADVNSRDAGGNDALGIAADQDNLAMIRLLLDHGADPKATNAAGTGALSLMVRHGNTAGVKLLLSKGADPQATDVMGRTCLYWLRGKPHSEIVALLRRAGANR